MKVRMLLKNLSLNLIDLAMRYSEGCWQSWKASRVKKLENANNPFVGGPKDLLARGIASFRKTNGEEVSITPLNRIRVRDLSDQSLATIGGALGKNLLGMKSMSGEDVVHPEFVSDFGQLVQTSEQFLMNNFLSASAVMDAVVGYLITDETTVDELLSMLRGALDGGNPLVAGRIIEACRASWIGRACMDGSWKDSQYFVFGHELSRDIAKLDEYVAVPVLKAFVADLENEFAGLKSSAIR